MSRSATQPTRASPDGELAWRSDVASLLAVRARTAHYGFPGLSEAINHHSSISLVTSLLKNYGSSADYESLLWDYLFMKKSTAKLQLKKSTIRVLQDSALGRVAGGAVPTENPEYCSTSCNICPSDHTWCGCTTSKDCP